MVRALVLYPPNLLGFFRFNIKILGYWKLLKRGALTATESTTVAVQELTPAQNFVGYK